MNQFNNLHGEETNEPPIDWNGQPPASHLKSRTSPPNNIPVVSAIMGRLKHHSIYNGDVEVHLSDFPIEFNSEYVPYPETTPIKSIIYDETDHLLKLLHKKHYEDLLDVYLMMLQD